MDINLFLDFMKEAGIIALNNQNSINSQDIYYKNEFITGIVTKTDKEISEMFLSFVQKNFQDLCYAIIDEENISPENETNFKIFDETEYQFILDPIDGTLTYASQTPLYAISLGILKKGKPYMGLVYAPALKELVYSFNEKVIWLKNSFENNQQKIVLEKKSSNASLIFKNARTIDLIQSADIKNNLELNLWSCVLHHLYLLTGRAKAAFVSAMLWDVAGTWAAFELLGFKIYNLETGKPMEKVSSEHFTREYRFTTPHLICKPEDYDEINGLIKN